MASFEWLYTSISGITTIFFAAILFTLILMSPQFSTKWTGNLRNKKICKEDSEAFYWDLKLGSRYYEEDIIFNFSVTFEVALSKSSLIHFTSQNLSLRIFLILSSFVPLGRPVGLFCLGLFMVMLTDILPHPRVLYFSKTSPIWFKINSGFLCKNVL